MSERYLWVDTLCIVHDDQDSMAQQLRLMGAIYARALLTICVTDGDAMTGLTGLRGSSPPRRFERKVISMGQEQLVSFPYDLSPFPSPNCAYSTRGWTFQEYYL
jgi:hypothetical protein